MSEKIYKAQNTNYDFLSADETVKAITDRYCKDERRKVVEWQVKDYRTFELLSVWIPTGSLEFFQFEICQRGALFGYQWDFTASLERAIEKFDFDRRRINLWEYEEKCLARQTKGGK
jgi:hypothetical protein